MKPKATFYHAGCSVCVSVEQALGQALDPARYDVEIVDFNTAPDRIAEAEAAGGSVGPSLCDRRPALPHQLRCVDGGSEGRGLIAPDQTGRAFVLTEPAPLKRHD
jgi:hypothetical protein